MAHCYAFAYCNPHVDALAIGDALPDRSLVLLLDEGGARARQRDASGSDAIGGRADAYHRKVDAAFRHLAAEEPERVRTVDASGSREEVTQRLLDAIADLLP